VSEQCANRRAERQWCASCRRRENRPRLVEIPADVERGELAEGVARYPANVAPEAVIAKLFPVDYRPGTFILAERKATPDFLDPSEPDFDTFIKEMVLAHLGLLSDVGVLFKPSHAACARAAELTLAALEAPLEDGTCLSERVTNQEATDTVWCLLRLLLFASLAEPLYTHQRQVRLGQEVALRVVAETPPTDLHTMAKRSVMSGLIGTNLKETTKLVGPSRVLGRTPFPLEYEADIGQQAKRIQCSLCERAQSGLALDCWDWYQREVLDRPGPTTLAFCTDDYVETVFDLHFLQAQMLAKPDLYVTILPRNGRYANDACHCDVSALLKQDVFGPLQTALKQGRLGICTEGPVMGGINGRKLSAVAAKVLAGADVVVVKGARAYEMLQGLRKPTYFAFNIVRSYTESLTGIDAETAEGAFVRQAPGAPSFSGFRLRNRRRTISSTGREMMLAEMTAAEYVRALTSDRYAAIVEGHQGNEELGARHLLECARSSGVTFAEAVERFELP
jgi:hypothetical protein